MEVRLEKLSRSFGAQQVLRDVNHHIAEGTAHAVLGGNGSGKSTLLRLVQGSLTPSSGKVVYLQNGKEAQPDKLPYIISLAGPYLELIEELTAFEFLSFYEKFRPFLQNIDPKQLLEIAMLTEAADKEIRHFSSGMRQRLRLAVAMLSQSSLILLDEPSSNLDPRGVGWYQQLVENYRQGRTMLVGSNFQEEEIFFCDHQLEIARQ